MIFNDNGIEKTLLAGLWATRSLELVPSEPGRSYRVYEFYVQSRGATPVDVQLMTGHEIVEQLYLAQAGSGFARTYDPGLVLPQGSNISLTQSGTTSCAYKLIYS